MYRVADVEFVTRVSVTLYDAALYRHQSGLVVLGMEKDDFRFQAKDPGTECLLVVGQGTPPLLLSLQFLLQRSNPPYEITFVKALERVVRRAWHPSGTSSTSSMARPRLVVRCCLLDESSSCLTVEGVSTWVPADHLEAQPGEARFQLARNLLEGFGGDFVTCCLQRGNASTYALYGAVCAFAGLLFQVSEWVRQRLKLAHLSPVE
jgi:hypothetical protein